MTTQQIDEDERTPPRGEMLPGRIDQLEKRMDGMAGELRKLRSEAKERDVRVFGDLAMLLAAVQRLESLADHSNALARGTAARVERLDRQGDAHDERLRALDAQAAAEGRRRADRAQRDAIARVRLEERIAELERRGEQLDREVTDAGQRGAVALELGRRALDSVHDEHAEHGAAKAEEIRGRWALRLSTRQAIVGGLVTLTLVAALTLLRWRFGAANVPTTLPLPAPAAAPAAPAPH